MTELRAPRRIDRMQPPIKDRSGETFQLVLIGLVGVVLAVGVTYQATRNMHTGASPASSPNPPSQVAPSPAVSGQLPQQPPPYQAASPQPRAAPTGPSPEQIRRYNAMQENCYRVTRMNANGEYPALQTSACNDYARYAGSIGLNPGRLPTVLVAQAAAPPPSSYAQSLSRARTPPAECVSLEVRKQDINATTRQLLSSSQTEYYREELRRINARMWDLNCRNH